MEVVKCELSGDQFTHREEDLEFYRRIGVCPPNLSPKERARRRLSFRNESSLHRRTCNGTGNSIISLYSPECSVPVYENSYWWSDSWDARAYGRDFDFSRPFFEQFEELLYSVPKMARIQNGDSDNSTYCNCASYIKNCYLIFSSNQNEDCIHGRLLLNDKNCIDCLAVYRSELCYECIQCEDCYGCGYLENCRNCSSSYFLTNCVGCKNCFGSVNLRNKSYCFLNEQLSREEYEKMILSLNLSSRDSVNKFQAQFNEYQMQFPIPHYYGYRNENVSGEYLTNSKNLYHCFELDNCEDCAYCDSASRLMTSYDVSFYGATGSNELLYQCEGVGHGVTDVMFSKLIWGGSAHIRYSYECHGSQYLFGCCGIKKLKYCIFNKEYTQSQYLQMIKRIEAHMKQTGEWGNFFPSSLSPFGYNETVAHLFYPLTEEEVIMRGLKWRKETVNSSFRIEEGEKELLKYLNLPLPDKSPKERFQLRHSKRGSRDLNEMNCGQCGFELLSVHQDRTVLCESCYNS